MALVSFGRGAPAPECLPVAELAECARTALERDGVTILSYGVGGGYAPLREWIGERHGVDATRVVITNGSLEGFLFLTRQLLPNGGGRVFVEAPTYDRPLKILDRFGTEAVPLPMDEEGLDPDALVEELGSGERPAFLYTIPTFQNPSGRTLSEERRRRLVELARDHDLVVLEDDPYGLVRYEGEPATSLFELDGGEHVIYSSSFSKTISPGLRVGYFVLPERLAAAFEAQATFSYISPPYLGQATIHEFVASGRFEPNLERVRSLLGARRDAMLAALERDFPPGAHWSRPDGGYFLWLDLPDGVRTADVAARAAEADVAFVSGSDFFPGGAGGEGSLRLAFSYPAPDEIGEGIGRLADLVAAATPAASR
jgi:DNA-binding transcriptional MocR family regulator